MKDRELAEIVDSHIQPIYTIFWVRLLLATEKPNVGENLFFKLEIQLMYIGDVIHRQM
jgi:hypothetical protein